MVRRDVKLAHALLTGELPEMTGMEEALEVGVLMLDGRQET